MYAAVARKRYPAYLFVWDSFTSELAAGGRTDDRVQEKVKAKGGITKITKKWTTANKETKIVVNSPFVKEHFLFRDNSVIKQEKEYRDFLRFLTGYTMAGRNSHDDAPDADEGAIYILQQRTRTRIFKPSYGRRTTTKNSW